MATLDVEIVVESAGDLVRAGRWDRAVRLLDVTEPADRHEAGALAGARASADSPGDTAALESLLHGKDTWQVG